MLEPTPAPPKTQLYVYVAEVQGVEAIVEVNTEEFPKQTVGALKDAVGLGFINTVCVVTALQAELVTVSVTTNVPQLV